LFLIFHYFKITQQTTQQTTQPNFQNSDNLKFQLSKNNKKFY
jgi:hypothetical protein